MSTVVDPDHNEYTTTPMPLWIFPYICTLMYIALYVYPYGYLSIYIKKNVCLFVRYLLRDHTSKCNETFHGSSLHPGEGRRLLFSEKKSMMRLLQATFVTDQ